jgi:hypothetical protein
MAQDEITCNCKSLYVILCPDLGRDVLKKMRRKRVRKQIHFVPRKLGKIGQTIKIWCIVWALEP